MGQDTNHYRGCDPGDPYKPDILALKLQQGSSTFVELRLDRHTYIHLILKLLRANYKPVKSYS